MSIKSFFNAAVICLVFGSSALAQSNQKNYTRADFINVDGGSLTDRVNRAVKQFRDSRAGDTVWIAYHFPANEELSVGPFSGTIYRDDDGIRLVRKEDPAGIAVLLLVDATPSQAQVTKVRTINMTEPYVFENRPVYWLGNAEANESVNYIEGLMKAQPTDKVLIRGALRAIGSHSGSRVVPLLRDFAQNETTEELQRAAISNLGRVGSTESIDVLIAMYDGNATDQVKDEVINALGRQNDRKASDKLLAIAKNDANPKLRQAAIRRLSTKSSSFYANYR
jgi:hypothetical protein